jgi:hypothetical protein
MNNDLSDEAFWKWELGSATPLESWQECRRRAKAVIEEEKCKAFEAGWDQRPEVKMTRDQAYRAYKTKEGKA